MFSTLGFLMVYRILVEFLIQTLEWLQLRVRVNAGWAEAEDQVCKVTAILLPLSNILGK